jgi:hypothetical protein
VAKRRPNLRGAVPILKEEIISHKTAVLRASFHRLVEANPVQSHRSMSSWRPSADSPSDYIEPEGASHQAPGDEVIDGAVANAHLEATLYMTNNMPYELRLAEGWSKQQEKGWIERELQAGIAEAAATRTAKKVSI